MSQFLFTLIIMQKHTRSAVIKSVNLTTNNTNGLGATISEGLQGYAGNDVQIDISTNFWHIRVGSTTNSQRGYHLEIDLDKTWGFHPTKQSNISFTMYSTTDTLQYDLDLLVSFSVNSTQYLTYWIGLDGADNTIYPGCDQTAQPTQILASGDVLQCVEASYCDAAASDVRDCKATGGCAAVTVEPPNFTNGYQNQWPLTVTMINDPLTNKAYTFLSSPSWAGWAQGCGYGEAFSTDIGSQIYVAIDDPTEHIDFYGFYVEYEYETESPTLSPTSNPTSNPSPYPTLNPSTTMPTTNEPSKYPTSTPTTMIPTTNMPTTLMPTTSNPTTPPTVEPTLEPTLEPTAGINVIVSVAETTAMATSEFSGGSSDGETATETTTKIDDDLIMSTLHSRKMIYYGLGLIALLLCFCCFVLIILIKAQKRQNKAPKKYSNQSLRAVKASKSKTGNECHAMKRVLSVSSSVVSAPVHINNITSEQEDEDEDEDEDDYILPSPTGKETRLPPPPPPKRAMANIEMVEIAAQINDEDQDDDDMDILAGITIKEDVYVDDMDILAGITIKGHADNAYVNVADNGDYEFIIGSVTSDISVNEAKIGSGSDKNINVSAKGIYTLNGQKTHSEHS